MIDQFMLDGGWKSQLYPIDVLGDERAQFFTTVKTEQLNFSFEYVLSLSVFSQALVYNLGKLFYLLLLLVFKPDFCNGVF